MKPIIRKGTKITCPKCNTVIAVASKDIYSGDVIDPGLLEFAVKKYDKGDPMECPVCGFPVGVETSLGCVVHTENGWVPEHVEGIFNNNPRFIAAVEEYLRTKKTQRFL